MALLARFKSRESWSFETVKMLPSFNNLIFNYSFHSRRESHPKKTILERLKQMKN